MVVLFAFSDSLFFYHIFWLRPHSLWGFEQTGTNKRTCYRHTLRGCSFILFYKMDVEEQNEQAPNRTPIPFYTGCDYLFLRNLAVI